MYDCRVVELVFPRSGQVLPVQVPVEIFELVSQINHKLLSFIFSSDAMSSSFLDRLREA
jgi:hypothetical protein